MSKIRATTRLTIEDFPEQKSWIGKLISPINDFITQGIQVMNGGVNFTDNIFGKDHLFDFTYQSDSVSLPIGFQWLFNMSPKSLIVVSATEDTDPVNIAVAWELTPEGIVQLTSIVRFTTAPAVALLQAGKRYKIRCRVTP